jgi:hypothetical protein
MSKDKLSIEGKQHELTKFRDLVLATIDYLSETSSLRVKTDDFDSNEHLELLKKQALELFNKGRLTKLKQWFRDMTEMEVESRNLKFNKYLQKRLGMTLIFLRTTFDRFAK